MDKEEFSNVYSINRFKKHKIKIQEEELNSAKFIKFEKIQALIEKTEISKYGKVGAISKKIIKMSKQVL